MQIVKILDPTGKLFAHVFSKSHCLETRGGIFIKDLRIIRNRDIKKMLVIDSNVASFGLYLNLGYPILPWEGEADDIELAAIYDYLQELIYAFEIDDFNNTRLNLQGVLDLPKDLCLQQ
eukprot:TRINITY_DN9154_c0_g1_i14.p3 TRINITY_DN9154_c0_g1~~TRINITY_DN9154_c0_g1_i14.p3  ORF type:complete len:119 (+),score=14.18 TRINITY_DN9154_c0_g1_i14:642-998(+)